MSCSFRKWALALPLLFLFLPLAQAGVIRGTVTDTTGATVTGATVVLFNGAKFVSKAVSTADGSFQFTTGQSGRFTLLITAQSFRQLEPPAFYAGINDSVERILVLEPEWVHQSIVVTATGTPTPQQQTSEATTVLDRSDIALRSDLTTALRLMNGTVVTQLGQRGAQTSLFVRGGPSDGNKIILDGVDAGDLGGRFDFGPMSTTGIHQAEIYRGPNSNLYGADAGSGVVSFSTPRGTASSPTLRLNGDLGNFRTSSESGELAGSHKKLDYYSAYSWLQTSNALPNDQFHVGTAAGNFGWQPMASTQVRGTVHYGIDGVGSPNAWNFYRVADDATQKDQDLFVSGSIDNQTTLDFHNRVTYGMTRKREQFNVWQPSGELIAYDPEDGLSAYYGNPFTLTGANGYTISGRAQLDFPGTYPEHSENVSNRDQLVYQGDYKFTPHLTGLIGFRFEDERGLGPSYLTFANQGIKRTNYDYLASVHGDFHNRLFYTLGGSLEHYQLYGTQTLPRAGLNFYAVRPRRGVFSGTRILFNFGDAVREPTLTEQLASLNEALITSGIPSATQLLHIAPIDAPTTRTYEGGVDQAFLGNRITFRATYFHNQFGRQIESVPAQVIPKLLPGLTPDQIQKLIDGLGFYYTYDYGLYVNSEAYRAQGIEATVESGIGRNIFLRGGYTYTDAVVQRSFDSDNQALADGFEPTAPDGTPIGAYSPLKGARPFRIPPHTGFVSASYAGKRWTWITTGAFASRSDDSTFLEYSDLNGGNSLLLPNHNLDYSFAKVDLAGSFQIVSRLAVYTQTENLLSNQHIAPIGYPSLPFNFRVGLRLRLGKGTGD